MKNIMVRAGLAVLGLVLTLAWWTMRGGDSGQTAEGIPSKVWEGGTGDLRVEAESSCPVRFSISFSEMGEQGEVRSHSAWEKKPAGAHSWTVGVPPKVGGIVEMCCESPKVGDKLSWKITASGKLADEQNESLDGALKPGYAFCTQAGFADYASGKLGE